MVSGLIVRLWPSAELVDAGQARGEIATQAHGGGGNLSGVASQDTTPVTLADLGISRQRLYEARKLEPLTGAEITAAVDAANWTNVARPSPS